MLPYLQALSDIFRDQNIESKYLGMAIMLANMVTINYTLREKALQEQIESDSNPKFRFLYNSLKEAVSTAPYKTKEVLGDFFVLIDPHNKQMWLAGHDFERLINRGEVLLAIELLADA